MAFFNLTMLGPQNPFKNSIRPTRKEEIGKEQKVSSAPPTTAEEEDKPRPESPVSSAAISPRGTPPGPTSTPPTGWVPMVPEPPTLSPRPPQPEQRTPIPKRTGFIIPDHTVTADDHEGSYEYMQYALRKHQRNPQGPNQLYRRTLTSAQDNGRWLLDQHPQPQPWTQGHRHAHVNSEMTRFVDEMSVTNKDFSLF